MVVQVHLYADCRFVVCQAVAGCGAEHAYRSLIMELSSFSENIVTEKFERNGESVELQINIDAIVPDYFDVLALKMKAIEKKYTSEKKSKKPESHFVAEKRLLEIQREAFAEMLTCRVKLPDGSTTSFLKDWDITENGMKLACTKENLLRLPPRAVQELFEFCKLKATTVKKRVDEETEATSERTHNGSMALRAV